MARVLLIEDDPAVREGLELALSRHGHRVSAVESGELGLERLRAHLPDVVVLDLMLPGMDGFEVCRRIRAVGQVPIIMVTARGDDMDVVAGLEAGADDYVVKPVQPRVLEARIRAVLRRIGRDQAELERYGELTIDRAGLVVASRGVPVGLAPTELRL
ncbi:response regulator transcription factor, partial [Nonomuraea sp. NPDC003709]|uniref:response regulator transcription factor n=1 Tax=Nonomuraea sp. NPDC003709 TaxID=3154450 RepID=UPI0033B4C568